MIDRLHWHEQKYNIRASVAGGDVFKHEYREANQRADALTHDAREGRERYVYRPVQPEFKDSVCVALRGRYDGGVDAKGSGIGFWLQAAFLSRPELSAKRLRSSFSLPHPHYSIVWSTIAECAARLPRGSTITDCELTALERLTETAQSFLCARPGFDGAFDGR